MKRTRMRLIIGWLSFVTLVTSGMPGIAADGSKPAVNQAAKSAKSEGTKQPKQYAKKAGTRSSVKSAPATAVKPANSDPKNEDSVALLKQELAEQQKQIEMLRGALAEQKQLIERAIQSASSSQTADSQQAKTGVLASLSPVIPLSSRASASNTAVPSSLSVTGQPGSGAASASQDQIEAYTKKVDTLGKTVDTLNKGLAGFKLGATFFGDWGLYTNTGFGPQFLTQINQPGPGNAGFNSFDVTRTYINILYTPTEAVTLRLTPNIYRQVDVSSSLANGKNSAIGSSSNGNLGFRLKYAYIDFNTLFKGSKAFGDDKLTLGQTTNPLVDWEEGLYGYRYVNLVPWNYLSLSSTYVGATLHGPIKLNGKEYLDYHIGVFNTASFHAIEQNDRKQVMARATWYPVGTTSDRTGFGLTAFMDYGYNTKTPDTRSIPLYRFAVLGHYQTLNKAYLIAGEYDLGRNAFSTGNLFSGVGPADEFGLGPTPYATFDKLAKSILGGEHTLQRGFSFFGHAKIGNSPFALFGMYHYFQPNTNIATNPLDFHRTIAGISYHYNAHLDISLDDQNLKYNQSQFTLSHDQIAAFDASLASKNPSGIPNAVPQGTNAIFVNLLFNY